MALIQKYNSGGSFKNYVESKILSDPNSMSTKDQAKYLRQIKWRHIQSRIIRQ